MEAVLHAGKLSHLIKGAQLANEKQVRFESWQPSPGGSVSKESVCSAGDWGSIPGWGRSPGKGNGNLLSIAWEIPWTEKPGGLQSMESQRIGHELETKQQ